MVPGTDLISGELLTGVSLATGGMVIGAYIVGISVPYTGFILIIMALLVITGIFKMIISTESEKDQ